MRVKISEDEGSTFSAPCDLETCFGDDRDDPEYAIALDHLTRERRYWIGGGASPLFLIVPAN